MKGMIVWDWDIEKKKKRKKEKLGMWSPERLEWVYIERKMMERGRGGIFTHTVSSLPFLNHYHSHTTTCYRLSMFNWRRRIKWLRRTIASLCLTRRTRGSLSDQKKYLPIELPLIYIYILQEIIKESKNREGVLSRALLVEANPLTALEFVQTISMHIYIYI